MGEHRVIVRVAWVASVLWMGVIFGLSAVPAGSMPAGQYSWLGHYGVYLVLGGLYFIALRGRDHGWKAIAIAVIIASAYGVTDEFHQSFVPGRVPDPADWLMDTAGALSGALIAFGLTRRRADDPLTTHDDGAQDGV